MPDEKSVEPQDLDLIRQSVDSQLTEASKYDPKSLGAAEVKTSAIDSIGYSKKEEQLLSEPDADPDFVRRQHKAKTKKLEEEVSSLKQDRGERKKYANRIFNMLCLWLSFDGFVLLLHGNHTFQFFLGENVLIALIGATTTSVIGVFLIVANYLFPKRKE